MEKVVLQASIRAPREQVFATLADHEGFPSFSPLRRVTLRREGSPDRNGLGAVRVMTGPGMRIEEEVISWDPPNGYQYRLLRGAPIRDHRGEITVKDSGGASQVQWTVQFRPVIPGTGWLVRMALERALGGMLRSMRRKLEQRQG